MSKLWAIGWHPSMVERLVVLVGIHVHSGGQFTFNLYLEV